MSPRTKKQFEQIRSDRKLEILGAALIVFAEKGYHAASISKIASNARISKGLIYNYFESKKMLLTELLHKLFERVVDSMDMKAEQKMTDELMIRHVQRTFEIIEADRRSWKLYFSMISQPEVMEVSKQEMLPKVQPFMVSMITYFQEKGYDDPMAMMRYFLATMDGAKMQYLFDPESFPMEEIKTYIIQQFIKA